jgi:hypothetical protein
VQGTVVGDLKTEFGDAAEIPDWRLRQRLLAVATALDAAPEATLPKAMKTTAAREGAYRFLGNRRVSLAGILAPHVRATVDRCRQEAEPVFVVSDTTECSFGGEARGEKLGRLSSNSRGFLAHFAIAVSSSGDPLGVLGIETVVRTEKKAKVSVYQKKRDPDRESLRWAAMVEQTSALFDGTNTVHVMDSEADIYELLTELQRKKRRYIIRNGQDRLVEGGHLDDVLERGHFKLQREVNLSRRSKPKGAPTTSRRNPPRDGRTANLAISTMSVAIRSPRPARPSTPKRYL